MGVIAAMQVIEESNNVRVAGDRKNASSCKKTSRRLLQNFDGQDFPREVLRILHIFRLTMEHHTKQLDSLFLRPTVEEKETPVLESRGEHLTSYSSSIMSLLGNQRPDRN